MGDSSESLVLGLGYLPTPPDVTKKLAGIKLVKKPAVLPKHVDFSGDMKPPKYQNGWASCVPFGLLGALDSATLPDTYSEAYNWYKTKQLHGNKALAGKALVYTPLTLAIGIQITIGQNLATQRTKKLSNTKLPMLDF
ncbi:hypothetical protein APSETT445_000577 [Aspergillus pseudonomiae]